MATTRRCAWAGSDPLYLAYHDNEWGVPLHDDRRLFEMLILEGAQAGLSWITILRKRNAYQKAFDGFDPRKVARYRPDRIERLMKDDGIVRNRLKFEGAVRNAAAFVNVQREFGSFDSYIWQFVAACPKLNAPRTLKDVGNSHRVGYDEPRSEKRVTFVGSTICYAFMQATAWSTTMSWIAFGIERSPEGLSVRCMR